MVNTLFKTSLICSCLLYSMGVIGNTDSNSETWKIDNEFFKKQVKQTMSPGRAVRSLISHYVIQILLLLSLQKLMVKSSNLYLHSDPLLIFYQQNQ